MKTKNHGDRVFSFWFIILIGLGLIVLFSVSFFKAGQKFNDYYFYLKHQLISGFLPGLLLFFLFSYLDYHHLKKIALPFLILSVIFLALLFIPGLGIAHGASVQWLNFGFVSFQPSELAKLSLIIYLSFWLARNKKEVKSFSKVFLPLVVILAIFSYLIAKQPDFGAIAIIFTLFLILYFTAGGSLLYSTSLLLVGVIVAIVLISFSPYHLARLTTFFHPSLDPGAAGYQINQSLLAIGSGGLFGRGLGLSVQKFAYLPEILSDSIFAILAEEFGFILTVLVIGLYVYLFYRIFKIASQSYDESGQLLSIGVGCWFIGQALINIGAMLGLVPLTGVTLPFLSYGGTSFCVFSIAFGIVYNISKQESKK